MNEEEMRNQQENPIKEPQEPINNYQQVRQGQKKKSNTWIIVLIVIVVALPIILAIGILIMTMLTSMGVLLYNNASSNVAVDYALGLEKINTFNSQWQKYEDDKASASDVKSLINQVKANNMNVQMVQEYGKIELDGITDVSHVVSGKYYSIKITDFGEWGAVSKIKIIEN